MKHTALFGLALAGGLLAACGGAAQAPPAAPASSAPAGTASPASKASTTAAKPAASAGIEPVTEANWAQTVEAAKKEGQVIIWGDNGPAAKAFEKDAFEKANPGITVELFQAPSQSDRDSRFIQEFQAGVAKVDIEISGSAGVNARVKPLGALQDVRPFLRPEILNPSTWRDGKIIWVDKEQKFMLQSDTNVYPVIVNKSVMAGELQNFSDLLGPRWKGKIVSTDPRQSGPGFSEGLFLYYAPGLGKDFFDQF